MSTWMILEWIKTVLLVPLLGSYFVVAPGLETEPSPYPGDSIDDIAIWVNQAEPSKSLILTTLKASNQQPVKETGILVYSLDGRQVQFLAGGTPNNIDIRYTADRKSEVIAVSHWFSGNVTLHHIDHRTLKIVAGHQPFATGTPRLAGVCLYQAPTTGLIYYIVTGKDGDLALFQIEDGYENHKLISRFKLDSATEGCVVDDTNQVLYIAEESTGVWQFDLASAQLQAPRLIVQAGFLKPLTSDVEGLTLYDDGDSGGYLLISSQGNDEYAVIDRNTHKHIANFSIITANGIDGTSHTDGIDLTNVDLGPDFPGGVFIAQDDNNTADNKQLYQNLKLVPLNEILHKLNKLKYD